MGGLLDWRQCHYRPNGERCQRIVRGIEGHAAAWRCDPCQDLFREQLDALRDSGYDTIDRPYYVDEREYDLQQQEQDSLAEEQDSVDWDHDYGPSEGYDSGEGYDAGGYDSFWDVGGMGS